MNCLDGDSAQCACPEPVRTLAAPWITDPVIGDMCHRFPRIRIDFARLPPLDAVDIPH